MPQPLCTYAEPRRPHLVRRVHLQEEVLQRLQEKDGGDARDRVRR